MKTKTLERLFCVLLTGCVLLGAAACGKNQETGSGGSGAQAGNAGASGAAGTESAGGTAGTDDGASYEVGAYSGFILDYGKYADVDWSEKPSYKIGFSWMSQSDILGSMYQRAVAYACDVFHCEMQFVELDFSSPTFIGDAAENICQSGCDGMVSGMLDAASIEACEKYGVYYVGSLNQMSDELLAIASKSDYFCGNVIDDDYLSCYNAVVALYDAGCRNILWTAGQPGQTQADIRAKGFEDAIAQYDDLNVVTTVRMSGNDASQVVNGIESALAAYPELDGIALGNGVDLTAMLYATGGNERVKVASTDLQTSYGELFADGIQVYCATDQYPTECIAFTLLYNALSGHPILDDTSVQTYRKFLEIRSYEEYVNMYNLSFLNIFPYTAEQLLDLCVEFNPEADEVLYQKYCDEYTIESIAGTNQKYLDTVPYEGRLE